ncbi:3-beta hydroxysteroid dehydrogenase/isomerase [Corchorus olitorius]|uniref:3-beta hydroxysteroid dehydrogenase/isomerase n=1 Tax=Corchorus olitorius TaxID=93759 RepID=A0A1R3JNY4_9ROSI|nr:3-beta hydroxysteroid dehydrogenase/isomerase [Corchorus olitorius]
MSGQKEKVVCVTGASGFIASRLVNLLLRHGYTVKATVRDPSKSISSFNLFCANMYNIIVRRQEENRSLVALDGAKERLQLFKAELLDEGAFDSIVDGCIGVFHTASPCFYEAKDPQAELIDPAVKGTLNVVRSCVKVPSIKRVIITSSLGAVVFTGKPLADGDIVDETWFSDPDFCEKSKGYFVGTWLWTLTGKKKRQKQRKRKNESGRELREKKEPKEAEKKKMEWVPTSSNLFLFSVFRLSLCLAFLFLFQSPIFIRRLKKQREEGKGFMTKRKTVRWGRRRER